MYIVRSSVDVTSMTHFTESLFYVLILNDDLTK